MFVIILRISASDVLKMLSNIIVSVGCAIIIQSHAVVQTNQMQKYMQESNILILINIKIK